MVRSGPPLACAQQLDIGKKEGRSSLLDAEELHCVDTWCGSENVISRKDRLWGQSPPHASTSLGSTPRALRSFFNFI